MKTLWQSLMPWSAVLCCTVAGSVIAAPRDVPASSANTYPVTTIIIETHQGGRDRLHPPRPVPCCRAGMTLPVDYRDYDSDVDEERHPKLTPPTRYQQWVKVNNQYILLNVLTHTVIKVVTVNP